MSYEIEYKRFCLKSENGYSPIWLAGSSNCTQTNYYNGRYYEKRERHWSFWCSQVCVKEEQLLEFAKSFAHPNSFQQHWKRKGEWIDDKGVVTWVKSAMKSAIYLEDLLRANHYSSLAFWVKVYPKDENGVRDTAEEKLRERISTTQQFDAWALKANELMKQIRSQGGYAYPYIDLWCDEALRMPVQRIDANEVLIKCGESYVSEYTEEFMSRKNDIDKAKVFSQDEAIRIIETGPFSRMLANAKLVDAAVKLEPFEAVVGYGAAYVLKKTRNKIHFTTYKQNAKRFKTVEKAQEFCDKWNRFCSNNLRVLTP